MTTDQMSESEQAVREFAAEFPTPAVHELVAHCAAGRIEWTAAERLAHRSLAAAIAEIGEEAQG